MSNDRLKQWLSFPFLRDLCVWFWNLIWNNARQRIYSCTILKSLTHCLRATMHIIWNMWWNNIVSVFSSRNLLILKYLVGHCSGRLATCCWLQSLDLRFFGLWFSSVFLIYVLNQGMATQQRNFKIWISPHSRHNIKSCVTFHIFSFSFHKMMSFS